MQRQKTTGGNMTHRDPKIEKIETLLDRFGNIAVESFHYIALFIIGCMVIWSAGHTVFEILTVKQFATIDDILLLFIYLELGAMVGIYFKTNHMPVRFLIYIAITALTRLLISDIQHDHKADMDLVIITGSILILAVAILIVRYASWTFPSVIRDKHSDKPLPEGKTPRPQDDELA
jgi:protein PsiE